MFLEPAILSIIVAKLRGGHLRNLENVYIKGWHLFIIVALIQGFLSIGKKMGIALADKIFKEYLIYVVIFMFFFMLIPIIFNIRKNYMKLFLIGLALNFIVMVGNSGKMPVFPDGITGIKNRIDIEVQLPHRESDIKHEAADRNTKFISCTF